MDTTGAGDASDVLDVWRSLTIRKRQAVAELEPALVEALHALDIASPPLTSPGARA